MTRIRECRVTVGALGVLLSLLVLTIAARPAHAVVVKQPDGQYLGITPRAGVDLSSSPGAVAARRAVRSSPQFSNGNLNFHGGQVIHSSAPYLVFWDPSGLLTTAEKSLVTRYMTDLATDSGNATNVFPVDRQFTDASGFVDYRQTFNPATQVIVDTQAYPSRNTTNCPDVNATFYPHCLADAQLQTEITRLIAADSLPTGIGANAPYYQMLTPPDTNVCSDAAHCADNAFCAYHSSFTDASARVLYAADPMFHNGDTASQNPKACQLDGHAAVQSPNAVPLADVAIKYISHEFNETITDPINGGGWWNSNTGLEDGDNCDFFQATVDLTHGGNPNAFLPALGGSAASGTLYDQVINGHPYYTQTEWSNGDVGCKAQPAPHTLTPSFVVPAGPNLVGASLAFDPTNSTIGSGDAYTSVSWNFGDGSANAFSRATAPVIINHTYSARGVHTVTLTVVDSSGNLVTASHQVVVGIPPVPAFTPPASPAVSGTATSFDASGTAEPDGVPIASYAWDFGDGATLSGSSPRQSHTYAAAGVYTVTLTVTDSDGLSASVSRAVTVDAPPVASLSVLSRHPVAGAPTIFDGSGSSDSDGTITGYAWSFGDGSVGSGARPSHTFARPGTYKVQLVVTDAAGASAIAAAIVTIIPAATMTKVSVRRTGRRHILRITLTGAGSLTVGRRTLTVGHAGTVSIRLNLSARQSRDLSHHRKVKLTIRIGFTPLVGLPTRRTAHLVLRS